MSYINVEEILPREMLKELQEYVEGAYIYIPRKKENRVAWGEQTSYRQELAKRNERIREAYHEGMEAKELAENFHLSIKSIYRIISQQAKDG